MGGLKIVNIEIVSGHTLAAIFADAFNSKISVIYLYIAYMSVAV